MGEQYPILVKKQKKMAQVLRSNLVIPGGRGTMHIVFGESLPLLEISKTATQLHLLDDWIHPFACAEEQAQAAQPTCHRW